MSEPIGRGRYRTVVVTGTAGALGRRVGARLAERPDVERVVGIDVERTDWAHPKLDAHVMDLGAGGAGARAALEDAMAGAEGVIHLAWRTPDRRGTTPAEVLEAAGANRKALGALLAAASSTQPATLVHLSSATVYGAWADNNVPLTEDQPLRPNPELGFAVNKAEAERVVAEWADAHPGVNVAVLRPAATVGTRGHPLYEALGATQAPRGGDGRRPVQYLHVDDLVEAVVLAWERRLAGVYNVAPDGGVGEDEARALAGGVARLPLPRRVAEAVASWTWQLWRRGVPVEARAFATHPWVVAPDRLKAAGWVPRYTSEEALVATDARPHWDDLPPGRRQRYNVLLVALAGAGVAGAGAAAVAAWRRRRSA